MPLLVRDYAELPRRPSGRPEWAQKFRELTQELRKVSEEERLEFIRELALVNTLTSLALARNCLTKRRSFEILLEDGLNRADASSIRYWLETVVPRLGIRRVVSYLRDRALIVPEGVEKAAYWLPLFSGSPGYSREEVASIRPAAQRSEPPEGE